VTGSPSAPRPNDSAGADPEGAPRRGALHALGLDRPELRAWALYDWANSAFVTTVVTAVFPVYFASVCASGLAPSAATARFAMASTVALVITAAIAPLLGALADRVPIKKKLLGAFAAFGVLATVGLAFVGPGDYRAAELLFVAGNIGLMGSFTLYDALLPHVARDEEVDRVSAAGYALGYLGGGLLLFVNIVWLRWPAAFGLADAAAASRLSFASAAVWWAVFSVPLFVRVREPRILAAPPGGALREAFGRLARTGRMLKDHRPAAILLVAYLFYNDGIGTIYRMAAIYGSELGLSAGSLLLTLAIAQIVSIPFAFAFGALGARVGARRALFLSLAVYLAISVFAFFLRTELHFFGLAMLVASVQGGAQSLSRSLFATLVPRDRSAQFFGLFGVTDKVSGILGPAVFAAVTTATGSSRYAIVSVSAFFVVGGALLAFVDVPGGQRRAREGESEAR
jgi:UMF1 family MFS transporter